MHLFTGISFLCLALTPVLAIPGRGHSKDHKPTPDCDTWDGQDGRAPRTGCLTQATAERIVDVFTSLFEKIDADVARKFLTPDFQVYSDSSNYIEAPSTNPNYTAGAVTFPDRETFITGQQASQAQTPPGTVIDFGVLAVYAACDAITFRWRLNTLAPPTTGIDVIQIRPGTHEVYLDFSEFNNIGLLANFGCTLSGGACSGGARR